MLKTVLAGALALAVMGSSLALAQQAGTAPAEPEAAAKSDPVVTAAHIARIKAALKLTPGQERYWGPVEAALRDLARRRAALTPDAPEGRRVMIAAMPLIHSLNEDQKREAIVAVKAMGFTAVASAL